MNKRTEILLLSTIVAVSLFLRLYKLTEIPNGFYVDEAAIGYNAYSISVTAKDEFGKNFPLFFKTLGAYSSPLYVYALSLLLKFKELDIFTVRFISAVSGTLATILVYLITKKLSLSKNIYFPLIAAFIFTILPWTIFTSRGIHEPMFALSILLAGIWLFLISESKKVLIYPAFLLLALSAYAYQAERLLVVLLVPLLFFYTGKKLSKTLFAGVSLFVLVQLPQILVSLTPGFSKRASGLFYSSTIKEQSDKILPFIPGLISWVLSFTREFGSRFLSYLSPRSLFWEGDPDLQRSIPNLGAGFPWVAVPYLIGLFLLLSRYEEKGIRFIGAFSVISIIPAALTGDPFATLRALPLTLPLCVVISLGIEKIYTWLPRFAFILIAIITLAGSSLYFWRSYFILLPAERAASWGYGFEQLSREIKKNPQTFYLIDQTRTKPAYIELAFFWKYPPKDLQSLRGDGVRQNYYTDTVFDPHYKFSNIETRNLIWEEDIYKEQVLVGDEFTISKEQAAEHFLEKVFEIKDPVDRVVFVGYKTDPAKKCGSIDNQNSHCKAKN